MAELLYRIGGAAARHGWRTVVAWTLVLGLAVAGFGLGSGELTNNFDVPGTASSEVTDELERKIPDLGGAAGTVVLHTDDQEAFTAEQRDAYARIIRQAEDELPDVTSVVDPFATEQQRADQVARMQRATDKIAEGRDRLSDGQDRLHAGIEQLKSAQNQLNQARKQARAAGSPDATMAQLDARQEQLDQQRERLDGQQRELTESRSELNQQSKRLRTGQRLLQVADGIRMVSEDGSVALINVGFTEERMELSEASKEAVVDFFDEHRVDGVSVDYSTEIAQGVPDILGPGEVVGLLIAGIVLLVMLGTPIAAGLPIVTAVVGVAIGALSSLAFSGAVQMASVTPVLGVMLGLAVGIDYSLFIVNRHRRQLAHGLDLPESIALANGTAGNAVLFAGSTVVVALLALNVTGVSFLGVMGTVGAACIIVAVLIAVTLTPAVLGLVGERILGKRARARLAASTSTANEPKPMRTLLSVGRIVVCVAVLLVVAVPALSMRLGLPDGGSEPEDATTHQAYQVTEAAFGAGANATLLVTAELPAGSNGQERAEQQLEIARTMRDLDNVEAVAPAAISKDHRLAAFQVKPEHGPNAESTAELVHQLRDSDVLASTSLAGSQLGVAGQAAINIDISQNLADVLPLYLVVVVGLSLLIMIVVFRSLLVPVIATGGFVLSLLATYGATVAVFQWGWLGSVFGITTPGPVLSFLPVILVGILFGLAMDYQLFLASGMRESYVHGASARLAVVKGFHAGRSVVTAAALIMAAVFGGFVFSESTIIRSVGFGLAIGVLLDAFVVRLLLMPALMHLVGRWAWWMPGWLDRILPNTDVEGAALERRHNIPH